MLRHALLLLPLALLAGCAPRAVSLGREGGPPLGMALAPLLTPDGNQIGTAEVVGERTGTRIVVRVQGLPPGDYGLHLHAVGRCEGPAFASAGPHFNPAGHQHGRDNPQGAHAGDLPNITVEANGSGRMEEVVAGLMLKGGAAPLFDADGAAVVLHARPDDYRTDPAGNAGTRIACAVLSPAPAG
jgi:Cu-Zn family superoxide dismutase